MGCASSRCRSFAGGARAKKTSEELRADIRLLRDEIEETRRARQHEARDECDRRLAAAAVAEEERRRHEEEAARLQKAVKEKIYRRRRCLDEVRRGEGDGGVKEWRCCSRGSGGGRSMVEQARREETVEKWKQLYLTIKTELDELIHRTREQGGRYVWGTEQSNKVEELQKDLREKEESVEALTSQIAAMQKEAFKKDRENDILRQCLRILGSNNTNRDLSRTKRQFNKKSLVS